MEGQSESLVRRGMTHHQRGDFAAAIADYTAALAISARFPEAINNRGVACHALGDYLTALADFDQALAIDPAYAEAWNNRGVTRHAQGNFTGALADFAEALRLRPDYAEAYNNRGSSRQALGDLSGALADFEQALRLASTYAEAHDNRGNANYLLWRHAEAIADFTRAIELYGPAASPEVLCRLHVCRGDAHYHNGSISGLVADYAAAFRIDADQAAELIAERLAKDIEANFRILIANCDKHLVANPDDFIVHARRGLVFHLVGHDADAQREFDSYYQKRKNPPPYMKMVIDKARQYRDRHGAVIPGNTGKPTPYDG